MDTILAVTYLLLLIGTPVGILGVLFYWIWAWKKVSIEREMTKRAEIEKIEKPRRGML